MSKTAKLRALLPEIAAHRVRGASWPEIAKQLTEAGLVISANELRPYWSRLAGDRHPAEILLDAAMTRADDANRQAAISAEASLVRLNALTISTSETKELRAQVRDLKKRNTELDALRGPSEAVAADAEHLERLRAQMNNLQSRNAELEAALTRVEGAERRSAAAAAESAAAERRSAIEAAESAAELEQLHQDVTDLQERHDELQTALLKVDRAERQSASKVAESAEELKRLRRQVTDLQERNVKFEEADGRNTEAENEASKYRLLSEMLVRQLDGMRARIVELEAEMTFLYGKRDELQAENKRLENEVFLLSI